MKLSIAIELNGQRYAANQLANGTWWWVRSSIRLGTTSAMGPDTGIIAQQHPEQALKELIGVVISQCNLY